MPQWRDYLERFRPAGTPGAAARPGVPVDRVADATAELTGLLMLLDDVQDEAARIRGSAGDRADELRRTAHRQAAHIVELAHRDADSVRARAETTARDEAGAAWADMKAQTAAEVEQLQTRVAQRMPDLVDRVVSLAREWLDEWQRPSPAVSDV